MNLKNSAPSVAEIGLIVLILQTFSLNKLRCFALAQTLGHATFSHWSRFKLCFPLLLLLIRSTDYKSPDVSKISAALNDLFQRLSTIEFLTYVKKSRS